MASQPRRRFVRRAVPLGLVEPRPVERENKGWTTSATPVPGAVAWFPGGNHVAYVSGIMPDGSVALEEYNYSVDHGYSQRVIQPGQAYYLYPPG